jgi:hypothetical protein
VASTDGPSYWDKMRDSVERFRLLLKAFTWTCGVRNARIINLGRVGMNSLVLEEEGVGDHPVHPSALAYASIAEGIALQAEGLKGTSNKRKSWTAAC